MRTFLKITILCLIFLSNAQAVEAVKIEVTADKQVFRTDETFIVDIILDAEGENINTVETYIDYPRHLVELTEVRLADSIIPLWIKKPSVREFPIHLTGIIPNGFFTVIDPFEQSEQDARIAQLFFTTEEVGSGAMTLERSQVLLHDGIGTETDVSERPYNFVIQQREEGEREDEPEQEPVEDIIKPEPFDLYIYQPPDQDDYRLYFHTRDLQSGVAYYEIKTGDRDWHRVESPYTLNNQELAKEIKVRAVDNAGNERVEEFDTGTPQSNIEETERQFTPVEWLASGIFKFVLLAFLVVGGILIFFVRRRIVSSRNEKYTRWLRK